MFARVPFGECLCVSAALTCEIEFADGIDKHPTRKFEKVSSHGHYCVPGKSQGKVFGGINLYLKEGYTQSKEEEDFLKAVAEVISGIISCRQAQDKIRRALEETIGLLVSIIEMRDPYTSRHQKKVAQLCRRIAIEMEPEEDKIKQLFLAVLIHDIGKISVLPEIPVRPGKLFGVEIALIKNHPWLGYELLKKVDLPQSIGLAVLQHHERRELMAQVIPGAKILAVADVVEAMSSHRPYRPSLGIDKALEEIEKNKGKLYDSEVSLFVYNFLEKRDLDSPALIF